MGLKSSLKGYGEGEQRRSVSACAPTPTRHTRQDQSPKHDGLIVVCAHRPDAVRTRGQEFSEAVTLMLSALRLTALADKAP